MPIQYPSFEADTGAVPKIGGLPLALAGLQKGFQISQMPAQARQQKALADAQLADYQAKTQGQQLQNQYYPQQAQANLASTQASTQGRQLQNQYYPQDQASQQNLRHAQANYYDAQTQAKNSPSASFTGDMANAYNLERLRQQSLVDPSVVPYYNAAKAEYDNQNQMNKSLVDYRDSLIGSQNKRSSSGLGKLYQELGDVQDGFAPGTNRTQPLTPQEQQGLINDYKLKITKEATDQSTRERNVYGAQLDQTISTIDADKLTQYSGLEGKSKFVKDSALAAIGNAPQSYIDYQDNITKSVIAAKQMRQYLKDSVSQEQKTDLESLTNPSTWYNSPEVSKEKFNSFVKTFHNERGITSKAAQGPDVYRGKFNPSSDDNQSSSNKKTEKPLSEMTDEELQEELKRAK